MRNLSLLARISRAPYQFLYTKVPSVRCSQLSARPIFKVECLLTGERLLVKRSRLNAALLLAQLSLVAEMSERCDFIPKPLGQAQIGTSMLFEIWDWIDDACSDPESSRAAPNDSLDDYLIRFAKASAALGNFNGVSFPNESLRTFERVLSAPLSRDADVSAQEEHIISIAKHEWQKGNLCNALRSMRRSFVHTDIRPDNIRSGYLVDFSNSRPDVRLVELTRFVNLNYENPILQNRFAKMPWLAYGQSADVLSPLELDFFPVLLLVDFASILTWALTQIANDCGHAAWAADFVKKAPSAFLRYYPSA